MCTTPIRITDPRRVRKLQMQDTGELPIDGSSLLRYLFVPCGHCSECRKARASEWRLRSMTEARRPVHRYSYFVTLTFDSEKIEHVDPTPADGPVFIRRFVDNWRKTRSDKLTYWLCSDLGSKRGRLHFHGILYTRNPLSHSELESLWRVGYVWIGDFCDASTANYIVKYVFKDQPKDPAFQPRIYCSNGFGSPIGIPLNASYFPGQVSSHCNINGFRYRIPRYIARRLYDPYDIRLLSARIQLDRLGTLHPYPLNSDSLGEVFDKIKHNQTLEASRSTHYKLYLMRKNYEQTSFRNLPGLW